MALFKIVIIKNDIMCDFCSPLWVYVIISLFINKISLFWWIARTDSVSSRACMNKKNFCEIIFYDRPLYVWTIYVNNILITSRQPRKRTNSIQARLCVLTFSNSFSWTHKSLTFRGFLFSQHGFLIPKMVSANEKYFPMFVFLKKAVEREWKKHSRQIEILFMDWG